MKQVTGAVCFLLLAGGVALLVFYRTPQTEGNTTSFGGVSLILDYATTTAARERGLGGRRELPDNYGMLFAFNHADTYGFWMKDMLVPIDIFWLDDKGRVVSMMTYVEPDTYPTVFYPTDPARYVLETAAGFGEAHGIATGTPLVLKKLPNVSE